MEMQTWTKMQTLLQFLFCVSARKSKSKRLFCSTSSASSVSVPFQVCVLPLDSRILRREVRPLLCGMLKERTTITTAHRIIPWGNFPSFLIYLNIDCYPECTIWFSKQVLANVPLKFIKGYFFSKTAAVRNNWSPNRLWFFGSK